MAKNETVFSKDPSGKKLTVVRSFDASLAQVWQAWTDSTILDQWWAPQPWRAETKRMDFREGGSWLYCMVGPDGERSWCLEEFRTIQPQRLIIKRVCFCDEQGNRDSSFPFMYWEKSFSGDEEKATVHVELSFDSEADMQQIIGMGFQEGFTMAHGNLDRYLERHSSGAGK